MKLRRGLARLGTLIGRHESEFVEALGPARTVKTLVSGRQLVEWRGGLFRTHMIAVLFDLDHRFDAIVAAHPPIPIPGEVKPTGALGEPLSVRQTLALIDLRDAKQTAATPPSRPTLWARSRR